MQNPLENFKNPWDADGDYAQSFLNVDKVLDINNIFSFKKETPISSQKGNKYIPDFDDTGVVAQHSDDNANLLILVDHFEDEYGKKLKFAPEIKNTNNPSGIQKGWDYIVVKDLSNAASWLKAIRLKHYKLQGHFNKGNLDGYLNNVVIITHGNTVPKSGSEQNYLTIENIRSSNKSKQLFDLTDTLSYLGHLLAEDAHVVWGSCSFTSVPNIIEVAKLITQYTPHNIKMYVSDHSVKSIGYLNGLYTPNTQVGDAFNTYDVLQRTYGKDVVKEKNVGSIHMLSDHLEINSAR